MSVLPTYSVGSPNRFSGPAIPADGVVIGPLGSVNVGTVQVTWRASGDVSVSLVGGSSSIPVGSGIGGSAVVEVTSGLWAFEVTNTSGEPLDSVTVSMSAFSSAPDPFVIGSLITRTQPIVNVLAYGADPSGATDSTDAIQAALDTGGNVYLPPGQYLVNSSAGLELSVVGTRLFGAGVNSILLFGANAPASLITVNATHCVIEDIAFDMASGVTAGSGSCIDILESTEHTEIVGVAGFSTPTLLSTAGFIVYVARCYPRLCNGFIDATSTSTNDQSVTLTVSDCYIDTCTTGITLTEADDVVISNVVAYTTDTSVTINGSRGVMLTNCDLESKSADAALSITDDGDVPPEVTVVSSLIQTTAESGDTGGFAVYMTGGHAAFGDCTFRMVAGGANAAVDVAGGSLELDGCRFYGEGQSGSSALIATGAGTTVRMIGGEFGITDLAQFVYLDSPDLAVFDDVHFASGTTAFGGTAPSAVRNCPGYNPATVTTPAIPAASTAVTNTTGVDVTAYVAGGVDVAVSVDGTATGVGSGSFFVPAGGTINLGAYTTAPTWVWVGH